MQVFGPAGTEDIGMNIKDMLSGALPNSKRTKKCWEDAREALEMNLQS